MNVISIPIQTTKLWTVVMAGQLLMATLRRGWAACTAFYLILGLREAAVGEF